jgi:hypothetical protein
MPDMENESNQGRVQEMWHPDYVTETKRKGFGKKAPIRHARHLGGGETHNQQLPERQPDNRITSGS